MAVDELLDLRGEEVVHLPFFRKEGTEYGLVQPWGGGSGANEGGGLTVQMRLFYANAPVDGMVCSKSLLYLLKRALLYMLKRAL